MASHDSLMAGAGMTLGPQDGTIGLWRTRQRASATARREFKPLAHHEGGFSPKP